MNHSQMGSSYGLWLMVIINSVLFIGFAFSFFKPQSKTDWRSFGAFSAFIVALFAEMYGFPLTIYLFSGWLSKRYPSVDFLSHENGHMWHTILGLKGDPHFDIMHNASFLVILAGFWILSSAWKTLYKAQQEKRIASTGLYAKVRHPQYVGFILIMFGFLLQWPTLLTVIMFPILRVMYIRLAKKEEADARREFGEAYETYAKHVPAFIPKLSGNKPSERRQR